ncbi:glycosyltransferase family 4 protein [Paraburkholderia phymatum]|uniref:Glycosyltransferase family 4 protein n=1 Tax=Paraburkholderia phymatum TaxID=148447 RepID=A0ACC6TV86_9BURK
MKVLIVNNMAPFVWGGAEELAVNLQRNLVINGHDAEVLRIPFQWEPATRIPSQMLMVRAFELSNVDHVIALKFPAFYIRHSKKTLWLLHQYRQAYDLFDVGQTNLPPGEVGEELKALIRNADNQTFAESRHIFTNSEVTRQRLKKYNGFDAEVLLPPINNPELFLNNESRGYIFAGGRVNSMKRQHLLVEAMRLTSQQVKLVVAGPPDSPADAQLLERTVHECGLSDKVTLDLRFLPREKYAEYLNHAAAVAYLPFDEDSLGYVAMEAATAKKALITTTDSGGILGLVKNQQSGWVTEPTPSALAEVLNEAIAKPSVARKYGVGAFDIWTGFGITWPATVERLLR